MRLKPVRFFYRSVRTIIQDIPKLAEEIIPKIEITLKSADVVPTGGLIFCYRDVPKDMAGPFTLQIGYPVYESAAAPVGLESRRLEDASCAVGMYIGSMKHIGAAWGEFYTQLRTAGHEGAGEFRERYLYWEEPDSANNVTMFEVVLAAK